MPDNDSEYVTVPRRLTEELAQALLTMREGQPDHVAVADTWNAVVKIADGATVVDGQIHLPPMKPQVIDLGPVVVHNMPCAVYIEESAVLNLNLGVFHPSWRAQKEGWTLVQMNAGTYVVHPRSRFTRWLLRFVFGAGRE